MDLLDQRSPTLFVSRFSIDDDVDVRDVVSPPFVFPPLFVGVEFLFEYRACIRNRRRIRGPGK